MSRIRIGAHRGAMGYKPENTLAAFELAIEQGTYRIELDIRRTRDGVLVLMHDATVERTTDGSGRVSDLSWSEVGSMRAGSEPVPTLSQALECARGRCRLLVEVKDSAAVDDIVAAIWTAGMGSSCTISCFDEAVLTRVKDLRPGLATAFFHLKPGEFDAPDVRRRLGVDLLVVWPAAAEAAQIGSAKALGMQVRAGMRDDLTYEETAAEVRRLVGLGVEEVACGRPDWVGRALAEM